MNVDQTGSSPGIWESAGSEIGTPSTPNPQPSSVEAWSGRRWVSVILGIFVLQLGFIFWLGERPGRRPPASSHALVWKIAGPGWAEMLALQDPTLFLLPHLHGFSGPAWMKTPGLPSTSFFWTEPPRWLSLGEHELGSTFNRFIATNNFGRLQTLVLPEPAIKLPEASSKSLLPAASSLRIEGPLSRRSLLTQPTLRSWAHAELLTNSVVQIVIDAEGRPVSPGTLLASSGYPAADQYALEQVRTARFNSLGEKLAATPQNHLTWGALVFEWATIPVPATNAPAPPARPNP